MFSRARKALRQTREFKRENPNYREPMAYFIRHWYLLRMEDRLAPTLSALDREAMVYRRLRLLIVIGGIGAYLFLGLVLALLRTR